MRTRLRLAYAALRGRPIMYRMKIVNGTIHVTAPETLIVENHIAPFKGIRL